MKHVKILLAALSIVIGGFLIGDPAVAAEAGPPRVKELKFVPARPETGEAVKLRIALDGSALRAEVKISKNNDELETTYYDGISEFLELKNRFRAGDKIRAEVVPIDAGGVTGLSVSKAVEVANAPPTAKLVDQKITGNNYTARVESTDPEGDPITFSVKQGPTGLGIDEKGNLTWKIGETLGTFPISISVKDSHGAEVVLSYSIGLRKEQGRSGP